MKRYKKPLLIGGTMLAIFAILGAVLPTSGANILSRVLIMMLFGTAVNVMFGHSGLIAFGQGIFFGGAAYAYVLLVVRAGLNHGAAVVVTMLGVLAASFLIGKLCLRVQAFTFALLFMGLNILAYNIAMKVPALGSGSGVTGSVRPPMVSDTRVFFVMTLIVVAVCYFIIYKILHSSLGKVANGLRENEERLVFLGINVKNVKLAMIMVSSFFCGVAGVLYAMLNLGAYTAYLNVLISEEGLIMCIVGGRIGVLIELACENEAEELVELGKNIAMQIAALNPKFITENDVPADFIAKETEILTVQAKNDPKNAKKPDNIIEKMIAGRLKKELKEFCLVEQPYVKDTDMTVKQYIDSVAKVVGAPIEITRYVRFETGEGMEKKDENFAEEVAKAMN